jgi:hypothetical protein
MIDHLFLRPQIGKTGDVNTMTNNTMIFIMIPWDFVLLRHEIIFSDFSFKNWSFSFCGFASNFTDLIFHNSANFCLMLPSAVPLAPE